MKTKYDINKVPVEILRKVVIDTGLMDEDNRYAFHGYSAYPDANQSIAELLKSDKVPLRTRAQVDADIIRAVRTGTGWVRNGIPAMGPNSLKQLGELLMEKTSD